MLDKQVMVYGAYGYTGRLVIKEAKAKGLTPIVAGRDAARVFALAKEAGLPGKVFDLETKGAAERELKGVAAVLHCAGPFSATAKPMLEACLLTKTHYLDITGEIDVFEAIFQREGDIKRAGIVALPGVGFDVVPTDCLAAMMNERWPGAKKLTLAFRGVGTRTSPGSAKTSVEALGIDARARRNGVIVPVPGVTTRGIPFPGREGLGMLIPWGDVATAYRSTGIPNIDVFMGMSAKSIGAVRATRRVKWLFRPRAVQGFLKKRIEKHVRGPTDEQLSSGKMLYWGELEMASGERRTISMTSPEGYLLTAKASVAALIRVTKGDVAPGVHTPSQAFGARFITTLDGVEVIG